MAAFQKTSFPKTPDNYVSSFFSNTPNTLSQANRDSTPTSSNCSSQFKFISRKPVALDLSARKQGDSKARKNKDAIESFAGFYSPTHYGQLQSKIELRKFFPKNESTINQDYSKKVSSVLGSPVPSTFQKSLHSVLTSQHPFMGLPKSLQKPNLVVDTNSNQTQQTEYASSEYQFLKTPPSKSLLGNKCSQNPGESNCSRISGFKSASNNNAESRTVKAVPKAAPSVKMTATLIEDKENCGTVEATKRCISGFPLQNKQQQNTNRTLWNNTNHAGSASKNWEKRLDCTKNLQADTCSREMEISALNEQLIKLKHASKKLEDQNINMRQENGTLKDKLKQLQVQISKHQIQMRDLQERSQNDLKTQLINTNSIITSKDQVIACLEKSVTLLQDRVDTEAKDSDSYKQKCRQLEQCNEYLQRTTEDLQSFVTNYRSQIDRLRQHLKYLQVEVRVHRERKHQTQSVRAIQNERNKLIQSNRKLRNMNNQLKEKLYTSRIVTTNPEQIFSLSP